MLNENGILFLYRALWLILRALVYIMIDTGEVYKPMEMEDKKKLITDITDWYKDFNELEE